MTNVANARTALEKLKKKAPDEDKEHYDTLSAALESLGKRIADLEGLTERLHTRLELVGQAADRAAGIAAGAAGYAAAIPGAETVDPQDTKAMANQLAPIQKMSDAVGADTPAVKAENMVERIAALAAQAARPRWPRR